MKKINSKQKGKRGELEFVQFLRARGFEARRGVQYKGGEGSPDVISSLDKWFHIEVKRTERLGLYKALKQACDDAIGVQIPLVAHRANGKDWVIVLSAENFIHIIKQLKNNKLSQ